MEAIIELSLLEACPNLIELVDIRNPAKTLDIGKIIKLIQTITQHTKSSDLKNELLEISGLITDEDNVNLYYNDLLIISPTLTKIEEELSLIGDV